MTSFAKSTRSQDKDKKYYGENPTKGTYYETHKNKLTKAKKETTSKLEKYVYDYLINHYSDYEDKVALFTDVLHYGCQSGVVGELIYYSDTTKFYKKHQQEINELLQNAMWEFGSRDPKQLFGDKWDNEDPLCLDVYNQNLLAWFGFEETLRHIAYNFENISDHI